MSSSLAIDGATKLCEKCLHMFQGESHLQKDKRTLHADPASLVNAAAIGCYICEYLLYFAIKKAGAVEKCLEMLYDHEIWPPENWKRVIVYLWVHVHGKKTMFSRYFTAIPGNVINVNFSIRNRKSGVPLFDVRKIARTWLNDCLNEHNDCSRYGHPRSYPTRLLKLEERTMHLISPAEKGPLGPYVALSYCWGLNPSGIQLTASNLHSLREGIQYKDLPTAFQEAIDLIKSIEVHYLWIDSLCIVQSGPGSSEEWHSEAAKMQDVYSNCILNLSLSRAADPDESCLGGHTPSSMPPFEVQTSKIIDLQRDPKCTQTIVSEEYFYDALYHQPLGRRAWALQERLLAPRVLAFGLGELFWDCRQLPNACESFPQGFPSDCHWLLSRQDKSIGSKKDQKGIESAWNAIVKDYTNRELTYPEKDKLLALSAIAARFGDAMNDVYLSGHFWKTLPSSLNWRVPPSHYAETTRRKTRRMRTPQGERSIKFPSWSWASMDGPLSMHDSTSYSIADLQTYTLFSGENTVPAEITSFASLQIKAKCTELIWKGRWKYRRGKVDHGSIGAWVNMDDPDDSSVVKAALVMAALVRFVNGSVEGLLLKETRLKEQMVYVRVGRFSVWSRVESENPLFRSEEEARRCKLNQPISLFEAQKRTLTLI